MQFFPCFRIQNLDFGFKNVNPLAVNASPVSERGLVFAASSRWPRRGCALTELVAALSREPGIGLG
jgi:hypothetical protein